MGLARLLLLCAVLIWGWTFVATKICLAYLGPVELLGLRLVIALPVLALMAAARGRPRIPRLPPRTLLVGSGLFALHFLIQITGLEYTTATNTGWIIAVTPVALALLSRLLLGERITAGLAAGIVVATTGILLLVSGGRLTDLAWLGSPGDWLILVSAHTWALYTIAVRDMARSADPLSVTIAVLLPATLGCVAVMAVRSDVSKFLELPAEATVALLFLGVFGMALAQWFWQIGVARAGAARAGVYLYLEPLATTALAVPYLGEPFGWATLTGGALVLLGVWIAQRARTTPPGS